MTGEKIFGGNEKIPTVLTQAVKVIHPIFQDPNTGQIMPPPPDHEFRLCLQVSLTTKGRMVQESPAIFFCSGDDPEDMADRIRDLIFQGLTDLKQSTSLVQAAPAEALKLVEKFGK